MKLFPPQSDFQLYNEGFDAGDLLARRAAGQRLSELLERVEDPVVVAVDGPWGSGKSHFLKRWVGAHQLENRGSATTVYFDAFSNDYLDDPLIALTGAIAERFQAPDQKNKLKRFKQVAYKLARPLVRIAAATATAGATELVGPVADALIEAGGKEAEAAADRFWHREDGRKAAMDQFRASLVQLTASSEEDASEGKPLIVVVDELDRCRPDYALSVLEVVKHFFSVPRVHFVLGVNMRALEHMVRARYGAGVDAPDYLKRFISLSMTLPEFVDGTDNTRAQITYFNESASAMGIERSLSETVAVHLNLAVAPAGISLRDVEKILTRLVVLPQRAKLGGYYFGYMSLVVSLTLLQVVRPDLFLKAIDRSVSIEEIKGFYGITEATIRRESQELYNHQAFLIQGIWKFALADGLVDDDDDFSKAFDQFPIRGPQRILPQIRRDFFSLFQVSD